jgi:Cu(I)/Ag(I) efflux system membrane protein CusA/SilA
MIRDEDAMLTGYVYVDMAGRDVGGYVEDLKQLVRDKIKLPPGYTLGWSGQYEYMQRMKERLKLTIPLTITIIFVLYYFTFGSVSKILIVMLGVPFCLIGSVWLMPLLGYYSISKSKMKRRRAADSINHTAR